MSIISIHLTNRDRVSEASIARCLTILLMSALAPVLCPGCSGPEPAFAEAGAPDRAATKIYLTAAGVGTSGIRSLDLFFFNEEPPQRLDTYQRIEGAGTAAAVGASRSGRKILAVLANSPADRYRWADVNSLGGLAKKMIDLQEEAPAHPFMSGLVRLEALPAGSVSVPLAPHTARIELRSLRCDFRGRSYEGAALEDVKVYLTNVSATRSVLADSAASPVSFINAGRLNDSDIAGFRAPELICASLSRPVGNTAVYPGIFLHCYPNQGTEEGPGSPFTKLVIEGRVEGETCYYPIAVNRGPSAFGQPGIAADCTYRFDLTLTRKGSADPDGALEPGTVLTRFSVVDWQTQKDTVITF